ncbi:response regulator [Nocardia alni]|uniref:response regulator n=1 Tax=Nocardia alni TaxID=2815723 RepID=UPI001C2351FA|nr:response regulator transcription factor [Nocardia alni]
MSADIADGRTRLLLAEDHPMVVVALTSAFELVDDIEVVATSGSIAETLGAAERVRPDLILLDRRLPDGNGIDAIERLLQVSPKVRILVFTGDADRSMRDQVIEAGGAGLVLKTGLFDDLVDIIRQVAAGEDYFDPTM